MGGKRDGRDDEGGGLGSKRLQMWANYPKREESGGAKQVRDGENAELPNVYTLISETKELPNGYTLIFELSFCAESREIAFRSHLGLRRHRKRGSEQSQHETPGECQPGARESKARGPPPTALGPRGGFDSKKAIDTNPNTNPRIGRKIRNFHQKKQSGFSN